MTLSDTDIWVFVGYFLLVILTGLGIAFLILSAVLWLQFQSSGVEKPVALSKKMKKYIRQVQYSMYPLF